MSTFSHIAVVGAGSWGTALAHLLAQKGRAVRLWCYEAELAAQIQATRENALYLPGIALSPQLTVSADLAGVVADADVVVLVAPSHALRAVAQQLAPRLRLDAIVVCCTKGIEIGTGCLMSDILAQTLTAHPAERRCYLSGPSFAREVAEGQPTAVVIAGSNPTITKQMQDLFRTGSFMTFTHSDVIGIEVGGAVKNVLAIATGIADGLGLGHNSRAALITRGLYEIIKLGQALGAQPLTFAGLAGMGDLILTCTGGLSRNRQVGLELGKGRPLKAILAEMRMVAEGVRTAQAVHELLMRHHITAPICTAVYEILYENKTPPTALAELTALELSEELGTIDSGILAR